MRSIARGRRGRMASSANSAVKPRQNPTAPHLAMPPKRNNKSKPSEATIRNASCRQYHGQYQQQCEQRREDFRTDASQP